MKTGIYYRVSTDEQVNEGYSLESQKRKLLAYCELKGWEVCGIYNDEGLSGSSLEGRTQALKMLKDAKNGIIENILIIKIDRLCRNTKDLLEIVENLKKWNVSLTAVEENLDIDSPTGKLMLTILGSFAEHERAVITKRLRDGAEQKFRNGIYSRSRQIPYGFLWDKEKKHLYPDPDKVFIVKGVYNSILNGHSLNQIAIDFIKKQYKSSSVISWSVNVVRNIATNPVYKGFVSFGTSKQKYNERPQVKALNITPIIDEKTFDDVQKIILNRSNKYQRKFSKVDAWFGDVLYCSNCKYKLTIHRDVYHLKNGEKKNGSIHYRCHVRKKSHYFNKNLCDTKSFSQKKLNEFFIESLKDIAFPKPNKNYENEKIKLSDFDDKIKYYRKELISISSKQKKLLDSFLSDLVNEEIYKESNTEFELAKNYIKKQLQEIENQRKEMKIPSTSDQLVAKMLYESITKYWDKFKNEERKRLISTTIKRIEANHEGILNIEFY